jgi:hypothetical protein
MTGIQSFSMTSTSITCLGAARLLLTILHARNLATGACPVAGGFVGATDKVAVADIGKVRKVVRAICLATAVALACSLCEMSRAAAQGSPSAATMEAARALTVVVSEGTLTQLTRSLNDQVWPGLEASIRRQKPNIGTSTLLALRQELERQQLAMVRASMDDAAAVYARHFSIDEMRAIAAFYRTPAGEKALKMMPTITSELIAGMAPRLQALQAKVGETVVKLLQGTDGGAAGAK